MMNTEKRNKKNKLANKEEKALKKQKGKSSIGVTLIAVLLIMVAVATVTNIINYKAMLAMNHSIQNVTDSKVPELQSAYNIQYSLEAVQKDFYRYLATTKGETSHSEARNDYAADKEIVQNLVDQIYNDSKDGDQQVVMQKSGECEKLLIDRRIRSVFW